MGLGDRFPHCSSSQRGLPIRGHNVPRRNRKIHSRGENWYNEKSMREYKGGSERYGIEKRRQSSPQKRNL